METMKREGNMILRANEKGMKGSKGFYTIDRIEGDREVAMYMTTSKESALNFFGEFTILAEKIEQARFDGYTSIITAESDGRATHYDDMRETVISYETLEEAKEVAGMYSNIVRK